MVFTWETSIEPIVRDFWAVWSYIIERVQKYFGVIQGTSP